MRIVDYGSHFHVFWEFDQWHSFNLKTVKAIEPAQDRKYTIDQKSGQKFWFVAGRQRDIVITWQKTNKARIELPENMRPELTGELPPMAELEKPVPLKPTVILRPYQSQGIAQAMKFRKVLIADEQGLGKTIQSIGTMTGLEDQGEQVFPCLVVCPAAAKMNWQREFTKFSYKRAMVLDSSMNAHQKKNWFSFVSHGLIDVVIINYESLESFLIESFPKGKGPKGGKIKWGSADVVLKDFMGAFRSGILDECHRVKDPNTNQARFIMRIFSYFRYKILLSGTPVVNLPLDLFPQLAILGKLKHFGNGTRQAFINRYCDGGRGSSNLKELQYLLNLHCFFRREKKDVAKDLPPKIRQTILCEITTRDEYKKCVSNFRNFLKESGALDDAQIRKRMQAEILMQMMELKRICSRGKMAEVEEFVNEVMDAGEKLILFVYHKEIADACRKLWPHAVSITGEDSTLQRDINKTNFQKCKKCGIVLEDHSGLDHDHVQSDTKLIICNYKSAGTAITLTASSRVAFVEYPWTAADCQQCEDRAHRIGARFSVSCTYFMGNNTIDQRLWEIILNKLETGNAITGASDEMKMEMIDKTLDSLFTLKNADEISV